MRKEKQFLLDDIKNQIEHNGSFVIISYTNIDANKLGTFRRNVKSMKGGVEFVKKRIFVKAAQTMGYQLNVDTLPGHIGIVMASNEPLEMTKFVFKFRQENNKYVQVVGGLLDGTVLSGEQVEELSKLPSKDEMRAQLLGTLEAPMAHTLSTMEAIIASVIYCLDNKVKQNENQNEENS